MAYSRKHFRDIASILKEHKEEISETTYDKIVLSFVNLFKSENELFDEDIFFTACESDLIFKKEKVS